ncbi:BamA/TamA family outer membrane protein [Paraliomyxa miuraensis]|uniref:BamA/TamA family outer membrane protein n=1 Tax=Paraliomyxa miuraensis TaxID=376150 RepID=UPI00224CF560|nr:BamA/TamA family outer membrane protein [Paraliomyxa miuraensis]MCX4245269.1 BamA/TamA family outer membrane protein [Paraliomyxa miuraensis]
MLGTLGLAVALAVAPGSSPPTAIGPGGSFGAAARAAAGRVLARRKAPDRPAPGPRLSPKEEEPRGFRVQGHRILPVPTIRAEPSVGLTLGLRARYVYRPPGETFDHARLDVVGRVSTKRVQDHTLDLQLRDLLHRQEILDLGLRFVDDPVFPYIGIANFEPLSRDQLQAPPQRVHVRSIGGAMDYQQPFAVFEPGQLGIETTGYARWLVGARFAHDRIESEPDTRWIDDGNPLATSLRRGSVFGGLAWDSRDNGWSPTKGSLHDVSVELGGPWVGSTQVFTRFNGSFRFYRPIVSPKVILANQFLADAIVGDAPLWNQGELGGLLVREGIGGRDTGRGYFRRRFVGPLKLYGSVELRVEPYEIRIRKRTLTPALKAFMDVGYVRGPGQDDARPIISGGPGAYIVWDRFFVFRVDAGFSPEGQAIYFTTDHAF